jgi:hypothetical protein
VGDGWVDSVLSLDPSRVADAGSVDFGSRTMTANGPGERVIFTVACP